MCSSVHVWFHLSVSDSEGLAVEYVLDCVIARRPGVMTELLCYDLTNIPVQKHGRPRICVYVYVYIYIYIYMRDVCVYIYIYIERERDTHKMYICMCICICI